MLQYLGYIASIIILISLLMNSPLKLRWINLFGGITFAIYGFFVLGDISVGILNTGTTVINIYYLIRMYRTSVYFDTLPIEKDNAYLNHFLDFYKDDINKFFKTNKIDIQNADLSFYVLRNVTTIGIFVGNKVSDDTLRIDFDYVAPTYRDFSMGKYIFVNQKNMFINAGYKRLITYTDNEKHEAYLKRMGFRFVEEIDHKKLFEISY